VKAGPVKVQEVVYRIQAVGSLEAEEQIQVNAELDGVLTEVKFNEGDRVTTSTVIARIDPDRYRLEADRAEAVYRRAVAAAAQAAATLARREALARENLVSVEDLNQTRTANDTLAADVQSAKAARDIAVQNLSRSAVKPRHGGVVDKRLVDTGAFVRTGTPIASLVDLTRLRLRFKVSETESLRATAGQTPNFTVAATGDQVYTGQIYHVGQVADPSSRQVEVLAWVKNPGTLKPGFFAEVTLPSGSKKDATVVPETAIQASDRGFVAFAVVEGKAQVRQVEIGLRTGGGDVEILSGLKPGETIVYEGSDRLANGVSVTTEGMPPGGGRAPGGRTGGGRPGGQGGAGGGAGREGGGGRGEGGNRGASPDPAASPRGEASREPGNKKGVPQ
jgi:multidrug efflux system membrane fusion protein